MDARSSTAHLRAWLDDDNSLSLSGHEIKIEKQNGFVVLTRVRSKMRHRSTTNFLCHIFSTLAAYVFRPTKPSIVCDSHLIASTS